MLLIEFNFIFYQQFSIPENHQRGYSTCYEITKSIAQNES